MYRLFLFLFVIFFLSVILYQTQSIGILIGFLFLSSVFGVYFSNPLFAVSVPIFGGYNFGYNRFNASPRVYTPFGFPHEEERHGRRFGFGRRGTR